MRKDFPMEKHITNEKTGISYTLIGDYYIPDLILSDTEHYEIGRFGRERERYLKEHRKGLYTQLLTSGKLNSHLHEVDEQAQDLYDRLVKQYAEKQDITEQLKADNQMEWVGRMNNITNAVREVVMAEKIFT